MSQKLRSAIVSHSLTLAWIANGVSAASGVLASRCRQLAKGLRASTKPRIVRGLSLCIMAYLGPGFMGTRKFGRFHYGMSAGL